MSDDFTSGNESIRIDDSFLAATKIKNYLLDNLMNRSLITYTFIYLIVLSLSLTCCNVRCRIASTYISCQIYDLLSIYEQTFIQNYNSIDTNFRQILHQAK